MSDIVAVIGLGYVGLPLAVELSKKYSTIGYDVNKTRVRELVNGHDRTLEVSDEEMKQSNAKYTFNEADLVQANIYIITVPTPIDEKNVPDLSPIRNSTEMISKYLKKDDIVIYESTVYPGVTEEVCVPILEKNSGLTFNADFFCGYSPERINPGDKERTLTTILKITSGSTPEVADKVDELYKSIITAGTHKAPSIKVAEAAKVIENTQRDVNIAVINELALIFDKLNIDTNAVLDAAGTKWNFINMRPGLVGGHCIGVDPYYLTFKAKEMGYRPNLILQSRMVNNGMAKFLAEKTIRLMIDADIKIKYSNVLVLGLTFKENCPDMRNTKVVDVIAEFKDYGCNVDVYDPWVDPNEPKKTYSHGLIKDPFKNTDQKYDAIFVAVGHNQFKQLKRSDYQSIMNTNSVIIDVKGIVDSPTWRL